MSHFFAVFLQTMCYCVLGPGCTCGGGYCRPRTFLSPLAGRTIQMGRLMWLLLSGAPLLRSGPLRCLIHFCVWIAKRRTYFTLLFGRVAVCCRCRCRCPPSLWVKQVTLGMDAPPPWMAFQVVPHIWYMFWCRAWVNCVTGIVNLRQGCPVPVRPGWSPSPSRSPSTLKLLEIIVKWWSHEVDAFVFVCPAIWTPK